MTCSTVFHVKALYNCFIPCLGNLWEFPFLRNFTIFQNFWKIFGKFQKHIHSCLVRYTINTLLITLMQLSKELGFPVVANAQLTFTKCLEMKLQDHMDIIVKVAEIAGKEFSIEQVGVL